MVVVRFTARRLLPSRRKKPRPRKPRQPPRRKSGSAAQRKQPTNDGCDGDGSARLATGVAGGRSSGAAFTMSLMKAQRMEAGEPRLFFSILGLAGANRWAAAVRP